MSAARTGIANLPLQYGKDPAWLFQRMVKLALYSFAHGGKDGIPYPVDRQTYDQSIELLRKAIGKAKLGMKEKEEAENRLARLER